MRRPRVIVCASASVDGRLTIAPGVLLLHGDERWDDLAGRDEDAYLRLIQEYDPQVILEGSGSLVAEGARPAPLPAVDGDVAPLYQGFVPEGLPDRPGHRGWFTVVDGRGRVRGWMKEWPDPQWQGWHGLILVCHATPAAYLAYLRREGIPYMVQGQDRVDLGRALEKLNTRLGVTTVLSTAGGRLNGALLRAGLVDQVDLTLLPALIGGERTPALFDSPDLGPGELPTRLRLVSAQVESSGRVCLRYQVLQEVG